MTKFSIITVVFNREEKILRCINSLYRQSYKNYEHIIVDGASTDNTLSLIESVQPGVDRKIVSEPDNGIYDALNKAMTLCRGEFIGILHSDDLLADENVLSRVSDVLDKNPNCDLLYGDLEFFKGDVENITRKWVSGTFSSTQLNLGWMPPHPTVFVRRESLVDNLFFDTSFKISADYEFLLRVLTQREVRISYIKSVLVRMETGGASTSGLASFSNSFCEDFKAAKRHLRFPMLNCVAKRLRKVPQFLFKS